MNRFGRIEWLAEPPAPAGAPLQDDSRTESASGCIAEGLQAYLEGRFEPSLRAYSRALRFSRKQAAPWAGQVRCLLRLGEDREAAIWSSRALEQLPDDAELLACRGLALVAGGEGVQGFSYLDGAAESPGAAPWVWVARGLASLRLKHPASNMDRCLMKAVEMAPHDPLVLADAGWGYLSAELAHPARRVLSLLLAEQPQNAYVFFQLGRACEAAGDRGAARTHYLQAQALRPTWEDVRRRLDGLDKTRLSKMLDWFRGS